MGDVADVDVHKCRDLALPGDHAKTAHLLKDRVIGQEWYVVLQAKRGDPKVMAESCTFLESVWNGSNSFDVVTHADVKLDGVPVRNQKPTALDEIFNRPGVLLSPLRSRDADTQLCENEQRHQ